MFFFFNKNIKLIMMRREIRLQKFIEECFFRYQLETDILDDDPYMLEGQIN